MENEIEKFDNNKNGSDTIDENSKREEKCLFGVLSLRSGVLVTSTASFMLGLYSFKSDIITLIYQRFDPPGMLDIPIPFTGRSTGPLLSLHGLCVPLVGFYGAYNRSAHVNKYYIRMLWAEFVWTYYNLGKIGATWYNMVYAGYLKQEIDASPILVTAEDRRAVKYVAITTTVMMFVLPALFDGYSIYAAHKYQHTLKRRKSNN